MAWRQCLRFLPLRMTLALADWLGRGLAPRAPRLQRALWKPGIAVLVPECGTPELLARTLAALQEAIGRVQEAVRVIVLVNGAEPSRYDAMHGCHPGIEWRFERRALGYSGAVEALLRGITEDWVYLLNSDMRLEPDALGHVLSLRAGDVFAIASAIDREDTALRREETGLTAWAPDGNIARPYDVDPEGIAQPIEHLYAGGGASLFRSAPLKRFVARARCFQPFYFEDSDWGVAAWRAGWRVLFCPASRATHVQHATIRRWDAAEVRRVAERNLWWLEARQGLAGSGADRLIAHALASPPETQRELVALRHLPALFRARLSARRCVRLPVLAPGFVTVPGRLRGRGERQRPRLLWIASDTLDGPEQVRAAAREFEVVLLGNHAERYPHDAWREFRDCYAFQLVGSTDPEELRRMASQAIAHFEPDLVCFDGLPLTAPGGSRRA